MPCCEVGYAVREVISRRRSLCSATSSLRATLCCVASNDRHMRVPLSRRTSAHVAPPARAPHCAARLHVTSTCGSLRYVDPSAVRSIHHPRPRGSLCTPNSKDFEHIYLTCMLHNIRNHLTSLYLSLCH